MNFLILAAGIGSRLTAHTELRPKSLVEINGRSLLERQLEVISLFNPARVIIVGGYRVNQLRSFGVEVVENRDYLNSNMVQSLVLGSEVLAGDLLVTYGDIVYHPSILEAVLTSEADISIGVDSKWRSYWESRSANPLEDVDSFRFGEDCTVEEIGGKPRSLDEVEGQYIGMLKFSALGLSKFLLAYELGIQNAEFSKSAFMTDVLGLMIRSGERIQGVPFTASWIEVDTVEDLFSPVNNSRADEIQSACASFRR